MKPSLILIFGALLALATGPVFGAGEYQQARDGKTMTWNWQPKAGETASWSGDRDKDGYASGFGDLTLYNSDGKVFGLFYGNMTHGKFEGAVNMHTGGRVAHAYFVDGDRVTSWSRGAAKSTMTAPVAAVVEQEKAKAEEQAAKKERVEKAVAAATPSPKKEKPVIEKKVAKTEPAPPPAERPVRGPDSYHKPATEKPPAVAENAPLSAEEELKRTEPSRSSSPTKNQTYTEPTPLPKSDVIEAPPTRETEVATSNVQPPTPEPSQPSALSLLPSAEEIPPIPNQSLTEPKQETSEQEREIASKTPEENKDSSTAPPAKQTPADVSVRALTGPPSSLHIVERSPSEKSNRETEPAATREAPLSESEAINLADKEARDEGCPLESYQRPKVDHSAVKGRWALFYTKKSDASEALPATFSATVEDKTHRVEIRK